MSDTYLPADKPQRQMMMVVVMTMMMTITSYYLIGIDLLIADRYDGVEGV